VVGPAHPIRVVVGQDVVLPCRLSLPEDARPFDIRWTRQSSSAMVHHYRNGWDLAEEQLEAYAGRTEL
ncbi:Butyrophilin-like 10, partial [Buceros rhinoceros silvestris]